MASVSRQRALLEDFPGFGPATILEAHKELSRPGFALWAWLCCAGPDTLCTGRTSLAKAYGASKDRFDDVLRELRQKGYIAIIPSGPYRPSTIKIERKMVVRLGGGIVRAFAIFMSLALPLKMWDGPTSALQLLIHPTSSCSTLIGGQNVDVNLAKVGSEMGGPWAATPVLSVQDFDSSRMGLGTWSLWAAAPISLGRNCDSSKMGQRPGVFCAIT